MYSLFNNDQDFKDGLIPHLSIFVNQYNEHTQVIFYDSSVESIISNYLQLQHYFYTNNLSVNMIIDKIIGMTYCSNFRVSVELDKRKLPSY